MESILSRLSRAECFVRSLGYSPVYISLHGSQNYGLSINCADYCSDYDFKCVVLPSLRSLCEGKRPVSLTVGFEDGQIDIKDIRVFTESVCKMNPAYLECLLTNYYLLCDGGELINQMKELLPELLSQKGADFAKVCTRSFEEKARRMCHDSPAQKEKIKKYGYDGKQTHHMYRLLLMLRAFEESGEMKILAPNDARSLLLDLKMNHIALAEAEDMIDGWRSEIQAIEQRLTEKYGKSKDGAEKCLTELCCQAIYDHCRREVLTDGRISL